MHSKNSPDTEALSAELCQKIRDWGQEAGFQQIGFSDLELGEHREHLANWLAKKFHGEMTYMKERQALRNEPEALLPGTLRLITARMDYLPQNDQAEAVLNNPDKAYISRYALGRDYHKLARKRLTQLAQRIDKEIVQHNFRAFVDSAPVMERAFAEKSGLGWIGKNTMLINSNAGSWFFLGEIFTNLPLPIDPPQPQSHCGSCRACIDVCPTDAIVAPNQLDARRCISYLTIEHKGSVPVELRAQFGNRIYGCDDCQLYCPWNKFATATTEADFQPRHNLDNSDLLTLFNWSENEFLANTEGSAIRRIGYQQWLRNLAIAIGNAPFKEVYVDALQQRLPDSAAMLREHLEWAIAQQIAKRSTQNSATPRAQP